MTSLLNSVESVVNRRARARGLPPGPPLPRAAQLAAWLYRPLDFMEQCYARYGGTFTIHFPGWDPEVVVSDPDLIKTIFTASSDQLHAGEANAVLEPLVGKNSLLLLDRGRHLHHRRLMLPPFHGERMHAYGETMRTITDDVMDRWPKDRTFVFHSEMQKVTLAVILRTVFGVADAQRFATLSDRLTKLMEIGSNPLWLLPVFQVDLGKLTGWGRMAALQEEIDRIIYDEIKERRANPDPSRTDILSMLVAARDEDGHPMTDLELHDEMMTMLVAGHETTATAMSWAIYRILSTPAVEEKLRRELQTVVGNGRLAPEHLPKLEYMDATVKESLRLDPVIPMVGRRLQSPMRVGQYDIPAGTILAPCIHLTHRRPDIWPEPHTFRPERFLEKRPSPYEFFPFGGGVRRCIGMAFAMYEMKVVLGEILLRSDLRLQDGYRAKITRRAITFTPSEGVPMRMTARRS